MHSLKLLNHQSILYIKLEVTLYLIQVKVSENKIGLWFNIIILSNFTMLYVFESFLPYSLCYLLLV